jgi:hypothetical protein
MGAINKNTNDYEYPKIANKKYKYKCPCCEQDVIFKNGKIKQPHFAHYKSDNPCYYYDKPSETQIHKDAKLLMKTLLDNKKYISIHRSCNYCEQRKCGYSENICYDIYDDYNENTKAVIEYKFYYNNSNRSADVALIENDKIKYIFEICYKNKTKEENRPEPWMEINAEYLINKINSGEITDEEGNITIECIRNYKCNMCVEYEKNEYEKKKIMNIKMELYFEKFKQEIIKKELEEKELIKKLKQEKIKKELEEKELNEYLLKKKEKELKKRIKQEERELIEKLKQEEEYKIIKEEEDKLRIPCKCGIVLLNICTCEIPNYELMKLSNNFFCINCSKWKCRCK